MTGNTITLGRINTLGQRAVACRGWKWMPGMRTLDAMRVIHDPDRWPDRPCAIREGGWVDTAPPRPLGDDLPDLTDPATLGCLLALVRETWGDPTLCAVLDTSDGRWCVERRCGDIRVFQYGTQGDTEAEALVAVLEAAP